MLDNPTWYAPAEAPAKPKPRTAEDVVLAAARWIEEHGHSQSGHEQALDRYCPIEAIVAVAFDNHSSLQRAAIELLDDYVRRTRSTIGLTYWNARASEDEVVATMREAANA